MVLPWPGARVNNNWHELRDCSLRLRGEGVLEIRHKDGNEFRVELSLADLPVGEAWHPISAVGDITQRSRTEEELARVCGELEARVAELEEAARRIKTLTGVVPICMFCKHVRTEEQSWERIDTFLTDHTDAVVSHSLCPTCATEHYPDLAD